MSRVEQAKQAIAGLELDVMLISNPVNVRYLSGYTGSNGLVLLGGHGQPADLFLTDFRYATQSSEQVSEAFEREIVSTGNLLARAAEIIAQQSSGRTLRVGFEETHLTVRAHTDLLDRAGEGCQLIGQTALIERLRSIKDAGEIAAIRAAAELADAALLRTLEDGLLGRTENEVAIALEHQMRRLGAERPSFPSIVACGAHGALPHAEPRDVELQRDCLVTIDWGAQLGGYCSDCTRTFAVGEPGERALEVYELVLSAQQAGLDAVRAGVSGRDVDAGAREVIAAAGHGEHFGHGLGHGVGLEIHEAPRLSKTSEATLVAGEVVTVEPGVYLPGELGVRIEDLVLVGDDGCEILNTLPKQLQTVS